MNELNKKSRHILVVDDDTVTREFFSIMLAKLGFNVSDAADGERALEIIEEQHIDLIILDNILPKMLGWELVKIIHEEKAPKRSMPIPIIMLSAMTSVEDKVRAYELGVEDYIEKPFNFTEVFARINAVLRHTLAIEQLLQRESRIAVKDALYESIQGIAANVKAPLLELKDIAEKGEANESQLLERYKKGVATILNSINKFEGDVTQILEKDHELRVHEVNSAAIVADYRKQSNKLSKLLNKGRQS